MEGARRADEGQALLGDGDALEAVARDAMGAQTAGTGDPEGAIEFFDGAGRRLADAGRAEGGVTHSGSSGDAAPMVSDEGRRVLATMGARGGWSADDLCEATGLPAATVGATLIFCELAGQVRCDAAGRYQAVH
jgi:predicted Rossmann fold nucleotide-binding protein DprA/Smf involved in DNA uptake